MFTQATVLSPPKKLFPLKLGLQPQTTPSVALEQQRCQITSKEMEYRIPNAQQTSVDQSRRRVLLFGAALAVQCPFSEMMTLKEALAVEEIQKYKDAFNRFEIVIPAMWIQSEKPGAQVLFKNTQRSSSTLGITITPVKVPSLQSFGTIEEIGTRLLNAERQKDGFIDIKLLEQHIQSSRSDSGQYNVYIYDLDTTRGKKHVVTGVTIEGFQLFIVNGTCKIDDVADAELLEHSIDSFRLL